MLANFWFCWGLVMLLHAGPGGVNPASQWLDATSRVSQEGKLFKLILVLNRAWLKTSINLENIWFDFFLFAMSLLMAFVVDWCYLYKVMILFLRFSAHYHHSLLITFNINSSMPCNHNNHPSIHLRCTDPVLISVSVQTLKKNSKSKLMA